MLRMYRWNANFHNDKNWVIALMVPAICNRSVGGYNTCALHADKGRMRLMLTSSRLSGYKALAARKDEHICQSQGQCGTFMARDAVQLR